MILLYLRAFLRILVRQYLNPDKKICVSNEVLNCHKLDVTEKLI